MIEPQWVLMDQPVSCRNCGIVIDDRQGNMPSPVLLVAVVVTTDAEGELSIFCSERCLRDHFVEVEGEEVLPLQRLRPKVA